MKISYKGDYALRALLELAYKYNSNEIVPLTAICQRQRIPEKYLEQIMLILKKAGYVDSKRGIGGGFYLKKNPEELTLGEIIRQVDGPLEPTSGIKAAPSAPMAGEDQKALQEVWAKVTQSIVEIVGRVTFADVMRRADELRDENADFNYVI